MLISSSLLAQGVSIADTVKIPQTYKPEFRRQLNHDKIDAKKKAILASDGTADSFFNTSKNDDVNSLEIELNPFEILLDTFESCNKMALLK